MLKYVDSVIKSFQQMNFKLFAILMTVATAAAWLAWVVVIYTIDPLRSGLSGHIIFYTTLAIALVGTFTLLGVLIRTWKKPEVHMLRHTTRSLRHSILFAVIFIASLVLLANQLFGFFTMVMLIIIVALVELVFLSTSKKS